MAIAGESSADGPLRMCDHRVDDVRGKIALLAKDLPGCARSRIQQA
jgi:hypothetical protein